MRRDDSFELRALDKTKLSGSKIVRFNVGADLRVGPRPLGGAHFITPGQTRRSAPTLILDLLRLTKKLGAVSDRSQALFRVAEDQILKCNLRRFAIE
jgi:hypothetical protein